MNFQFSEERMLLKDSIEKYFNERYEVKGDRGSDHTLASPRAAFSAAHWRSFAELGWLSIPVGERFGGLGGDPLDIVILFEQLGRHLVVEPFLETALIGGFWLQQGDGAAAELLQRMMRGELQLAFAHTEPVMMGRAAAARTTLERTSGGLMLTGRKSVVYNAPAADYLIVSAFEADRMCLVLTPADAPGVAMESYGTFDGRCAAEVSLDAVALPPNAQLSAGASEAALDELLDRVRLALAAEAMGMAAALVEKTIAYAAERRQFGQRIADFQVLRHRMVDMYMQSQMLRSIVLAAACGLRERRPDSSRLLAAAKIKANRVGKFVSQSAMQIHGAVAATGELSIGRYLKRLTLIANLYESTEGDLYRFELLRDPGEPS